MLKKIGKNWCHKKDGGIFTSDHLSPSQLSKNIDQWFEAFHKAQEMCGGVSDQKRVITSKETKYDFSRYTSNQFRGFKKVKLSKKN